MNKQTTERLNKRLDAIEARRSPEALLTIVFAVVEPGEHGPVQTGEEWQMLPGGAVKVADAHQ